MLADIQTQNQGFPLYLALGDSLTVGVGSGLFAPGFVGCYHQLSEAALKRPICQRVYAKVGATTKEVLQSLEIPEIAAAVHEADIVTITAGANDLIDAAEEFLVNKKATVLESALKISTTNLSKILDKIHAIHAPKDNTYIIRLLNLYNPLPNIPQIDPWIQQFNSHLSHFSSLPHIKIADIYHPFAGHQQALLSADHIHPNSRGYDVMANAVYQLGFDHLTR